MILKPDRRSVVTGLITAAIASPAILQAKTPSEKVNLACCGIGGRGGAVVKELYATGLVNIVALCDTDMDSPQTKEIQALFPNAPTFRDFRQMFDKMGKDIEAVSIGTPDFSHFPIAMQSMAMGKHIFCEKPMGHSFHQVQLMMEAEKKYKVAAQMGNQGHSGQGYFQFEAWTKAGIIKNVTKITTFMNSPRRWHGKSFPGYLPEQPIPAGLDYDSWLSSAMPHPYNKGYMIGEWRSWYDFGNGALGDWGAHIFDNAHEFLKLGLPTEVDPVHMVGHSPYIYPQNSTLVFRFPARGDMPPVEMSWYEGQQNLPPLPEGFGTSVVDPNIPPPTSGSIDTKVLAPGKVIYGEGLTFKGGSHASELEIIGGPRAQEVLSHLPVVPQSPSNHFMNFVRACKGEEACRSNFAVAGPLCQAMALGIIAQRLNTKVVFDPKTQRIVNNKAADAMLRGDRPRKDWEQYYRL
ncbi:Gfo/Idh/MocA family oxidoreductase [Asticcacaulis sp. SL142]|uniref:Gfo/Idh/MocA family oxidoreductase n=1 Tax=Asticcacaulis sp. SL142 TaxID=2995155 RepID=UPI00226CFC3B|nr:Gfo/Idh/MocA family oxidoreductase [Asticcacaulis sp. SL142]WAC49178.1 Gfo/Idh/MocA family oxidoreductase [Asticcacaulis sp. SL142]